MGKLFGLGVVTLAVVVLASAGLFGWWYTIDQGERGVILRNGAVIGTADPGWHAKMPWIDSVQEVSVQTHVWTGGLPTYSRDQQPAMLRVSVNYRVDPVQVAEVYSDFGSVPFLTK